MRDSFQGGAAIGGVQSVSERQDNFRLLSEINDAVLHGENNSRKTLWGNSEPNKAKFFKVSCFIQNIKDDDKMFYLACPDCKKKVTEEPVGFRCEHCAKVYNSCDPTYMLSAKVADSSTSTFISFPREMGDAVLDGMSARDFKEMKESRGPDSEEMKEFFYGCQYKVRKFRGK
jgi:hypothetical protein